MFSLFNKGKIHLFHIFNHIFANLFLFLAYKNVHLFCFARYNLAQSRYFYQNAPTYSVFLYFCQECRPFLLAHTFKYFEQIFRAVNGLGDFEQI